ncbi:DUF445 domain-containing protein [Sporosalibacterium faouarense]|uniref:DUF445 domain-containing protein n=1 Tax=Sporosalibacterium faouarense TaxID=516123 RepID=UPI00141C8DC6|nr:DUF445 family protein [Sporosalibacterium faouarense]MTI49528.1 DUF445 family protein [Bacillota bacterium]
MLLDIIILAVIGALIGWLTNIIAIKLIFRPLNPISIPLLGIKFQGLIPKRRKEVAKSIGEVIEVELLSMKDIVNKYIENEDFSQVKFLIFKRVQEIIDEKLPAIIPSSFKKSIYNYLEEKINEEGDRIIKDLVEKMVDKAATKVSLAEIVEEKINEFDIEKIEEIVIAIAKKELKHIEVLGGVLGFIIGIIQGVIVLVIM